MEFVAALVEALAWPVAAFGVALLFRAKIAELLSPSMRRLKVGPVEAEWDRTLSEAEADLEQPGLKVDELTKGYPHGGPKALDLSTVAEISPTAAVMQAYSMIETALREKLKDHASEGVLNSTGAAGLARLAEKEGLTTPETLKAVEGLAVLRNLAAHGRAGETSTARAIDYLALADAVMYAINS
jgi:hypothetical protein